MILVNIYVGGLVAEAFKRRKEKKLSALYDEVASQTRKWIADNIDFLREHDCIGLGEMHPCGVHRIIAKEFVKQLSDYRLAVEMLCPDDNIEKMTQKQLHSHLVQEWGWEYQDFQTAEKIGYLSVIKEAKATQGVGCRPNYVEVVSKSPRGVAEEMIQMRDTQIQQNANKLQGKVLVYGGVYHIQRLENAARVIFGSGPYHIYFEPAVSKV